MYNAHNNKINSFTDLNAWKTAHKLALDIYCLTRKYPKDELYGLVSQLRRAVVSISSNISEGFSRRSSREKIQFYSIALGSTTELQNQLLLSRDLGYIDKEVFNKIADNTIITHKLINGLIKSVKDKHST